MSYKNSCNNIAGWDDVYYYSDNSALYSDGVGIRPFTTTVSSYEEVYLYLEKYFTEYLSGDFDISLDISLANWTPYLDENYQFNVYIYTSDTYYAFELESSQLSNKVIFEGNELSITLPFSDVFRMTRVGNLVTWYVGSTIIKQETITSGFTVEGIDIEWYYEANSASTPVIPTLKINNIEATDSAISSNADLDNPCLSFVDNVNTLNPSWSTSVTSYTCEASYVTNSYTMVPFTSDGDATVKVNSNSVLRGEIISIPLSYGINYLTTEVTAEDGITIKTYDITITRRATPLSDSSLVSFTCSQTLSPTFSPTTYEYNIEYPYVTPYYVRFIPVKSDQFAVMEKDGQTIAGGEYIYIYRSELELGNIDVTIHVTAEDGITESTYVFHIFQGEPSNVCTLSSITFNAIHGLLSLNAIPKTLNQVSEFVYEVTDLTIYDLVASIDFTKTNAYSTVYKDGEVIQKPRYSSSPYNIYSSRLYYGENIIEIEVVAQDGVTTNTYTFIANVPLPYQYVVGSGTENDPFQVWTADDLNGIRDYPGLWVTDDSLDERYSNSVCFYFKQMANIDLSSYANWECIDGDPYIFTSQGWTGYYDGNNFNISNLTINKTLAESHSEGLFKSINFPTNTVGLPHVGNGVLEPNNASIKNIHINNASITLTWTESGGALVGILAGSSGCNIFNCTVEGSINTVSSYTILNGAIGGLIGSASCDEIGFIYRCSANTVITLGGNTGNWKSVGGLIGILSGRQYSTPSSLESIYGIHECCSEGQIIWDYIPYTGNPNFEGYYNMSTEAPQNEEIGGLIGSAFSIDIKGISFFVVKNCYSTVDVLTYCRNYSGGLFGYCQHPVINCYSSGIVTIAPPHWWSLLSTYFYPTEENVNGSIGKATTTVWDGGIEIPWTQTSSYFDIDIGLLTDSRITQKTTSEMKTQSTFIGWDFENVWSIDSSINDGYPYLQWLPLPIPRMVVYTRCFYL